MFSWLAQWLARLILFEFKVAIRTFMVALPQSGTTGRNALKPVKRRKLCAPKEIQRNYRNQGTKIISTIRFLGTTKVLIRVKKYVTVAADRFSRWTLVMFRGSNHSEKILKFLKTYIKTCGIPRQINIDQGTNLRSEEIFAIRRNLNHPTACERPSMDRLRGTNNQKFKELSVNSWS